MKIKMLLWEVDNMMLCCISKAVYRLKRQCFFVCEKPYRPIREGFSNTAIETNRLFRSFFPDSAATMKNGCLQKHFKRMIQKNKNCLSSSFIPWAIKMLNAQNQRIESLVKKNACFFLHTAPSTNLSASFTLIFPDNSFGSKASRIGARESSSVVDSEILDALIFPDFIQRYINFVKKCF